MGHPILVGKGGPVQPLVPLDLILLRPVIGLRRPHLGLGGNHVGFANFQVRLRLPGVELKERSRQPSPLGRPTHRLW